MNEIRQFLQSEKDYKTGVLLYQKYGKNETLKRVFGFGENAFNKKKLLQELEKFVQTKTVQKEASPIVSESAYNDPALVPLYREQSLLHNQLTRMSREERKKAAFRILDISDEIQDFVKGTIAAPQRQLPKSPMAMTKVLLNNRSYISKFSGNPDKSSEVERRRKENETILQTINN